MKRHWIPVLAAAAAAASAAGACASPARGFCEAAAACDDANTPHDRVGESDDSVHVCTADNEGLLAVLRENDEPECHALADAYEAWFSCVQQKLAEGEECAGLRAGNDNECQSELDDIAEAKQDAGARCTEDER